MEQLLGALSSSYPVPFQLSQWAFFLFVLYHCLKFIFRVYDYYKEIDFIKGDYGRSITELHHDISDLKSELEGVRTNLSSLSVALGERGAVDDRAIFTSNSPLGLTDEGRELIETSGFATALKEKKGEVLQMISDEKLPTKYDLEHYCISLIHRFNGSHDKTIFTPVKDYLYENADVPEMRLINACAIYLRDMYLDEYAGDFE